VDTPSRKLDHAAGRRRYLIHISMERSAGGSSQEYRVCIEPWAARRSKCSEKGTLHFRGECALIQAVNPLLPCGSDVRDVLGQVESKGGFFYLIALTTEQARQLGWKE
jgi:hypothetical protein